MKKYTFHLLAFLCLILAGCTTNAISQNKNEIAVVYTNASIPDSSVLLLDKKGEITFQTNIAAMGIFQIASDNKGKLFFPVQYDNTIYSLSLSNKKMEKNEILPFPIYIKQIADFRITTFNSSLQSGTIEWNQGSKIYRLETPGFPRIATYDSKYIYVFSTLIEQKKSIIYMIHRTTKKIEQRITVKIDQANDLQVIDNRLFLTSTTHQNQIAYLNLDTKQMNYITLPEYRPEYMIVTPNNILFSYQGSNKLTAMDRFSLQMKANITLPQPVFKIKYKGNSLYILSQIPSNGQGLIGVYDISNWKLKKNIILPSIRDTLIQDMIVL